MTKATWFSLLLCLAFLVASCSLFAPESGEADSEKVLIQTDRTQYEAIVTQGRKPQVEITIPITYRNVTDETVYLIGCGVFPPTLQRRTGVTWKNAWIPVVAACLGPPWPIERGQTRRDTVHVFGFRPGYNAAPTFDTEITGTYRLVQTIYTDPEGEQPLPPTASNTFEVTRRGH